jgi:hypothetical protein
MNSEPTPIVIPDTFKPFKRNHWIVHEDRSFGYWYAKFPPGEMLNLWEQWAFAKELLRAGQEEGVYRIISARAEKPLEPNEPGTYGRYEEASGQSYDECVEQTLRKYERLRFFHDIGGCRASARLCYYDLQGNLVEAEIVRPGKLLEEIRIDLELEPSGNYTSWNYKPIELDGLGARIRERKEFPNRTDEEYEELKFGTMALRISIHTDIWFPKVWGYLEDVERNLTDENGWTIHENGFPIRKPRWQPTGEHFDNRELAQCHTPRFNNFIQRVKQLTLNYGGTWSIDRSGVSAYEWEWNEDGIVLDC